MPVSRSMELHQTLSDKDINVERNEEYINLVNSFSDKKYLDNMTVNKDFENILRDYQKVGYKWLKTLEHYGFGGILADDMGLGKTLQVIVALWDYVTNTEKPVTSIVVCPSSLVLNWKAELKKWCPKLKVTVPSGSSQNRAKIIKNSAKYNVLITSYDLLKRDIEEYENIEFRYIIADEAQYIKNYKTQNAVSLKSLKGQIKYALTGTPIENSLAELWSIFDYVMPGYLYTYAGFNKKFETPIVKYNNQASLEKLKQMIQPFILRRMKADVLKELPEKTITVVKNEMTPVQRKLYLAYVSQIKQQVEEKVSVNGFEKSKLEILMLLTRLRQVCCHPSLFLENYDGGSGKLMQCMEIITDAIEAGHKILLFSQYTSMFAILEEELKNINIRYLKLTGDTDVEKRVEMVDTFNNCEDIKVFLISLKAGGTGLNLTGADVVMHYDPWWNLSSENQATDRAYRIGQKNSVQVYKFITANSIEEKIHSLQEKKAKLSEDILSTDTKFINTLTKEEIMSLFG